MAQPVMKVLLQGEAAAKAAAQLLRQNLKWTHPITGKQYLPGRVWMGNKMLISASPTTVICTHDDKILEYTRSDFEREAELQGFHRAAKSAEGWCDIAEVQMAVICGLIAPWYVALGMTCAKVGLFYVDNKPICDTAFSETLELLKLANYMRQKYPTLCQKLAWRAGASVIFNAPKHADEIITKDSVGSFITDILKGASSLGATVTLKLLGEVLRKAALDFAKSGITSMATKSAHSLALKGGQDFVGFMVRAGYPVTLAEVRKISDEIGRDPNAEAKLRAFDRALQGLLPLLKALEEKGKQ